MEELAYLLLEQLRGFRIHEECPIEIKERLKLEESANLLLKSDPQFLIVAW